MKQTRSWMRYLADAADLRTEAVPGQPLLEIYGNERVLIEHHSGVMEYSQNQICIRMSYGILSVRGKGLELSMMTGNQLVITGVIESICL